jgi:hypothetical protein
MVAEHPYNPTAGQRDIATRAADSLLAMFPSDYDVDALDYATGGPDDYDVNAPGDLAEWEPDAATAAEWERANFPNGRPEDTDSADTWDNEW